MITVLNKKSDAVGIMSSALCLVRCITTLFLLIAAPVAWLLFSFVVLNEQLEGIEFPFDMVYFSALSLTFYTWLMEDNVNAKLDVTKTISWKLEYEI